jgi:hypothetical protein
LLTQKRADFELFKLGVIIINCKEHLSMMGLTKIVAIRAAMNNGLSKVWIEIFPDVKPVPRPLVELREIIDPN